jgi:hypothetical protein
MNMLFKLLSLLLIVMVLLSTKIKAQTCEQIDAGPSCDYNACGDCWCTSDTNGVTCLSY